MKITHQITYTVKGYEQTTSLVRSYRLTFTGVQKIIGKHIKDACVTRLETIIGG